MLPPKIIKLKHAVLHLLSLNKWHRKDESQLFSLENIFSCGVIAPGLFAASITAAMGNCLCKLSCSSESKR